MSIEHDNGGYQSHRSNAYDSWVRSSQHPSNLGKRKVRGDDYDTPTEESRHMNLEEWLEHIKSEEYEFEEHAYDIVDNLVELLVSKQRDYGSHNIAGAPGGAMNGLLVRMHDKLARIVNLVKKNENPNHESIKDSFSDLANYCIIAIMVINGWWEGAEYPESDK